MNRINDLMLHAECMELKKLTAELYPLCRDGRGPELMVALYQIITLAGKARRRCNDLGIDDPLRDPMGS